MIATHHLLSSNASFDCSLVNVLRTHMVGVCSQKALYKLMLSLDRARAQTWLDALQMVSAMVFDCSLTLLKAGIDA